MSDPLMDLVVRLSSGTRNSNNAKLGERFAEVRDYILGLEKIRIFIADSINYGHQSSSVNIMRSFIRWGSNAKFTLLLYGNIASLEPKIKLLIPQFSKLDEDFTLDGRTIKAIKLDDTTVLPKLPFGITGGFDDKEVGTPPPLTLINVSNFVELQPYAWNRGTNMIFAEDQKGWQSINLDTLDSLQIQKRAFYLPDPQVTESDWAAILGSEYAEKTKIVRFLVDKATAGNIHLCPIYGITRKFAPYSSLYNAVSGMLSGADRYPQAKRPIVALVIAEMQLDDQIQFNTYIRNPSNKLRPPTIKPSEDFLTWHAANNVKARVNPEGALTLSELEVDLKEVKSGNVLVVGLGRIPAVLFDYLYLRATLPPMLEGQNTAELMLNIGKPYLKLGSNVSEIAFGYPSLPLTSKPKGKDAKTSQEIAFRGLYDAPPDNWYESRSTFPPRILLKMIFAYVGGSAANPLTRYFNNLRSFYHDPVNDKLLRAMDILVNSVLPKPAVVSVSGLSLGEEGPIPKLYKELNDNLHNGVLNLLQVITSGLIYDYFKEIVTDSAFTLTNATVTINDDQSEVTVTGKSAALGVRSPDLKINFTMANEDSYAATVTMAIDSAWDLSGGQWLSLSNPSMQLRIDPVAAVPVMGAVAVKVRAGFTMNMSIVLPAESGIAVFQSTFTDPKPSITNIFQIVGGINLQNILPSQLQLFSDIEVQDFSIRYNYDDKQIDSIGVILGTPEEKTWKVVPSVEITKITLQATISSPANMAERETAYQIGGSFSINKSEAYVDASLPQLSISGGLREGSQPLHVASIIETYLGKDFVKALPDVITKAEIDILTFSLDRAAGTYSFGMHVRTSWPITIDQKTLFTIEELGLYISATSSEIDTTEQKQDTNGAALADKTTDITGKFNGVITILPDSANIGLSISASYDGPDAGWTFDTSTTTAIKVAQLLKDYGNFDPGSQNDYSIDSLALTITTGDNSWVFVGTVSNWKVDFLDLPAIKRASVKLGYNGEKANLLYHPAIVGSTALLILTEQEDEKGYFAEIEADIEWLGVEITTWIKFSSQSKPSWGLTWSKLQATVQQDPEQDNDWIGSIKFKEDTTLGSMVEAMVSWATGSKFGLSAPWDILSSISLNGLVLIYNFTKKTVRFSINIGPIELGFARIDSIGIAYQSDQPKPEDNGVKVTLEGSFLWLTKPDEPLSWDASKPETTPAPPGDGNKYLDLRLLAMGQHVTVKDITKADTIQKAIGLMRDMPDPKPGELPTVDFDPASSWLIGADFGVLKLESKKNGANGPLVSSDGERSVLAPSDVSLIVPSNASKGLGYFLTAQFVFNDPHLYGLRLALDGEPAKIFKGLDFQIMYRQVSETVGVYQAEITLPDVMRRLDVGAYTITLPVFGIAVYTNGDFMLDIGFPWNQDFTRSFSIEAIIYPGIPVVGSAGLYFGKLSSASTNKVPPAVNGTFNPVIVFGFGMQVGFGKSIEAGILKAGFSLTIVGILEGVIGKWNPYQLIDSSQDNTQLQGSYYFWLQGTLGIIGKLYGSIDFAIIKADVNLTIKLLIQLTYESFVSLALTVIVSVDVPVNIEINLGLFTIKIHFSFSLLLKESFTIDNHGEPPWKVAATKDKSVLHAPADHRLSFHRRRGRRLQALGAEGPINWSNLKAPAQPADLSGYLAPALTVARDEWSTSEDPKDQLPCYVTMLFIDSAPPS